MVSTKQHPQAQTQTSYYQRGVNHRNRKGYQYHLNFSLSLEERTCTPDTYQTAQSSQSNGSSL